MHSLRRHLSTRVSASLVRHLLPSGLVLIFAGVGAGSASPATAQNVALVPIRRSPQPMVRYDQSTTWSLHLKSEASIASPLIRLRDVATPLDATAPWWDRAGESIIGLMPLDEHPMVIQRVRLSEAVARSSAMPDIRWSGSPEVKVTFRRELEQPPSQAGVQSVSPETSNVDTSIADSSTGRIVDHPVAITPAERDRVTRLIQFAVDRYDVQLREEFDIQVDPHQPSLNALGELQHVDSLVWESPPTEGTVLAKIAGTNSRADVTAMVAITFSARPLIVVARESLKRGHVLSESDLMLVPAGRNVATSDALTDIADAVGMQVQTTLPKQGPVMRNAIAPMTVVQRGDLVEVQVVGGGITIATGARTLASGAEGELIPIETLEPRRKLMATVRGPGMVEIVTRPPRVR